MEKFRLGSRACPKKFLFLLLSISFAIISCSSTILSFKDNEKSVENDEFIQVVQISTGAPIAKPPQAELGKKASVELSVSEKKETVKKAVGVSKSGVIENKTTQPKKSGKKELKAENAEPKNSIQTHLPDIEDNVGFIGRRPVVDPFRVGEVVTHSIRYFKVNAGELKLKVEPFAVVNGVNSYTFAVEVESGSLFSSFYSVKDRAETWVGYDDLVPRAYQLHVKESGQLREVKSVFDVEKNEAKMWEKKVTKKSGEETKKQLWTMLPFSQNVFSALFYMRVFTWDVGKEYAYRVAHDEENLVFTGKAVRREVIDTPLGPKKAIVVKPSMTLKGAFKPLGNIFIWISDDDRKYILRIECEIKIGTLVSEMTGIEPGIQP